ncbi:MAG: 23S rRNA pseudouridine(2604) synthase RluF [Chitinophagaceae bacterium]|nr:23S rRNA pseudouridine(2604) synthase RluF [Chitinophagaceae bacterium]
MDTSLNKYISDTGFCSRREADLYIEQGRVTINGQIASRGNRVSDKDVVHIDDEILKRKKSSSVYLMLNKPKGVTCTTDQKDKSNIVDFVNYKQRIFPIGRLDKRSEGLIFLTDDGDIVNKILRAGNQHEKEYIVTVNKTITTDFIQRMRSGVRIINTTTLPCVVKQETTERFKIILKQGLNRQIRRMCEVLGYEVVSLIRVRIMNITLRGLPTGKWRYFTQEEITDLQTLVANSNKTADGDMGMEE